MTLHAFAFKNIRRLFASHAARSYAQAVDRYPVVIVGAGPTGLTLSHLLSSYGVHNLVVEKSQELTTHPQAHYINNRTMEVFRGMAGLATEIKSLGPPLEQWRKFVYCESMTGELLGEVDHFPNRISAQLPDVSPEPVAHLPQSQLLPLLLRRAVPRGSSYGHVIWGHQAKRMQQHAEGVEVWTSDATGAEKQLTCSYLVAADGAHSQIRQLLGVQMQGEPALQHLINIHFFSRDLAERLSQRPAMLYFTFNADVVAVIVAHSLSEGEFVAQVPYFPPLQTPEDFSAGLCKRLLSNAAGVEYLDVRIAGVRPWAMSAQVADRFSAGRVFLAGDAAHRFPPAGGFGMNSGIQDAHNLAWKLAAVLHGAAGQQLLDSYQQERRPIALANTALSVSNWREAVRVPSLMGLDPRAASVLNQVASAVPGPSAARRALLEAGLALGRWAAGPIGRLRRSELRHVFESGETLRLQFPREDLGFEYEAGAICAEQHMAEEGAAAAAPQRQPRNAPYVPTTRPGCRLPHLELDVLLLGQSWRPPPQDGRGSGEALLASTLDLILTKQPHLVLFAPWDPRQPLDGTWLAAATKLQGLVQTVVVLGPGHSKEALPALQQALEEMTKQARSPSEEAQTGATSWQQQGRRTGAGQAQTHPDSCMSGVVDFSVGRDVGGKWASVMGLGADGAVFVRPDGHVAWRALMAPVDVDDGMQQLRAAVQQVMACPQS